MPSPCPFGWHLCSSLPPAPPHHKILARVFLRGHLQHLHPCRLDHSLSFCAPCFGRLISLTWISILRCLLISSRTALGQHFQEKVNTSFVLLWLPASRTPTASPVTFPKRLLVLPLRQTWAVSTSSSGTAPPNVRHEITMQVLEGSELSYRSSWSPCCVFRLGC